MVKYRPEIDGLRTVAVLPVILYHAGKSIVPGGFIGVDIFFVISGFLITGILLNDLEHDRFSIVTFYERRARRILPALFAMLALCLPLAWLWMLPGQWMDLAKSIAAVTLFISNLYFWRTDDYFAPSSEEMPLLHTWSLAVEEQYYLLFPIFLLVVWRFNRRAVVPLLIAGMFGSFLLCEWAWRHVPSSNYYLLPTRAWELLIGSVCAAWTQHGLPRKSNILSGAGLALIAWSLFAIDETSPFPSYLALAPTIGAALILVFASSGTWVARLLSLPPVRGIGLISYSAYLWHQPLFAFARIRSIDTPGPFLMAGAAVTSLILGYLSWRFVERPFRRPAKAGGMSRQRIFALSGIAACTALAVAGAGIAFKGFPGRFDPRLLAQIDTARHDPGKFQSCLTGRLEGMAAGSPCSPGEQAAKKPSFLIIGDSIAASLGNGFDRAAKQYGIRGAYLISPACTPIEGAGSSFSPAREQCIELQKHFISIIKNSGVKSVIMSAFWSRIDENCKNIFQSICKNNARNSMIFNTILKIKYLDVKIFVISNAPEPDYDVPNKFFKIQSYSNNKSYFIYLDNKFSSLLYFVNSKYGKSNISYVDIYPFFCKNNRCDMIGHDISRFTDKWHPTGTTASQLAPYFRPMMQEIAAGNRRAASAH